MYGLGFLIHFHMSVRPGEGWIVLQNYTSRVTPRLHQKTNHAHVTRDTVLFFVHVFVIFAVFAHISCQGHPRWTVERGLVPCSRVCGDF